MSNVNEWNLGELLNYCQWKNILTKPSSEFKGCSFSYDDVCVSVGAFAAQCHSHDTGNSVRVYIVGAGDPYLMLNGTYWKRSGYDHNPFMHERGSWDVAFAKFVETLRKEVEASISRFDRLRAEAEKSMAAKEQARKAEVESLFNASAGCAK